MEVNEKDKTNVRPITMQVLSELSRRMSLASNLGTDTYGGDRDIYNALGYPKIISAQNYKDRYARQDIAKAIIDRPVKASWKGDIQVIENIKPEETAFEKKWVEIFDGLKLKSIFIRADKLTGLGRYSVLLLGLDDTSTLESFAKPVKKGAKLLYVKPLSEESAPIDTFDENVTSERYGLPLTYNVKVSLKTGGETTTERTVKVHYSRVVHIVEDLMESEVYGTPRLQVVYNRLVDLEKIIGGDGEMFWRGARPGYTGQVDKDYQMTPEAFTAMQSQIDEFENNLRRILVNEGIKYDALAQQIADPTNHVDVNIQMISAVTGIPKRILMGSERGELSSAQDKQEWISYVTSRREEQNEPMILRPFIDKLIEIEVLPKPADPYIVVWDKLFSLSDKEKMEIGKMRAEALSSYANNPMISELIPLEVFTQYFLNFDETTTEHIMDLADEDRFKETAVTPEEQLELDEERMKMTAKHAPKPEGAVKKKTVKKSE